MIAALTYSLMYLFFGVVTVQALLPRHRPLNRLWLGLSLGLLEEMWLPALFAFFFSFGALAEEASAPSLPLPVYADTVLVIALPASAAGSLFTEHSRIRNTSRKSALSSPSPSG